MNITIKEPSLVGTPKPLRLENLKRGDVFQYKASEDTWDEGVFLMVEPSLSRDGQAFSIQTGIGVWFHSDRKVRKFTKMELSYPLSTI